MANRNFFPFQALEVQGRLIAGQFSIAASGGAATKTIGRGWSVAKSGTGEYTITLEDSYPALISADATVQAATAVNLNAQIKSADVVTTKTIVINLLAGATPTEPSAVTVVHFKAFLSNSTVR